MTSSPILNIFVPAALVILFLYLARSKKDKYYYWYILPVLLGAFIWWCHYFINLLPGLTASQQITNNTVFLTTLLVAGICVVFITFMHFFKSKQPKVEDLTENRLLDEYIKSAQDWVFFYKSNDRNDANKSLEAYKKISVIDGELKRRNQKTYVLTPLLNDGRDAVRIVAAASLARPGDDKCIRILNDVASRAEMNPSNAVIVAKLLLQAIEEKKEQMGEIK